MKYQYKCPICNSSIKTPQNNGSIYCKCQICVLHKLPSLHFSLLYDFGEDNQAGKYSLELRIYIPSNHWDLSAFIFDDSVKIIPIIEGQDAFSTFDFSHNLKDKLKALYLLS